MISRGLRGLGAAAVLVFLGTSVAAQQAPPPDPVATGAWIKILGLSSGASAPIVLSEAEVNALLGSAQIEAVLSERAGISGLQARLDAGEVVLSGAMDAALLQRALGPLAPPAPAGLGPLAPPVPAGQPFQMTAALSGKDGMGEGRLLRGVIAGMEAPPALLTAAVQSFLDSALASPESGRSFLRLDEPFALPESLAAFEVRSGELHLTPASR